MALVKTVEMRVLAKAGDAQEQLDELAAKADRLDGDAVRMRFRVDSEEGKAQLDAIEARAKALGFSDVSIKVKVDGAGRAIADLEAVKHEEESVRNTGIMNRIGNLAGGIGGAIPGGLGPIPLPALAAAIPVIGALATELVGVASGFAAAGAGAGAFALLAMPAVKQVETAYQGLSAAQQKYQAAQAKFAEAPTKANAAAMKAAALNLDLAKDAIAKLPAAEQGAITGLQGLFAEFGKMSSAFQPQAFKVFADGLKVVRNLLPGITPFANTFATSLDGMLKKLAKFTEIPKAAPGIRHMLSGFDMKPPPTGWQQFLDKLHTIEGPALNSISTGIGKVAGALGNLLTTMSGKDVAHALNIMFGGIAGTINVTASAIQRFMQNFDGMKAAATSAVHGTMAAFKSMASGVASAVSTVISAWQSMISGIEHGVSAAIAAVSSLPGKIRALFAGAAGWLLGAGKAIIQGLINGIESMLGPLEGLASKVAGIVKSVAGFLGIHSPSTVMHGYGVSVVQGLIHGIGSQLPALEAAAKKAAAIIAARIKTETAYAKSVAASALAGLNLTSIDLTQGTVASGMQSYLASIKAFIAEIKALTSQHLNKGVLQQLIAAGPVTGGQYAQSILSGPGGVAQVNALYKQIQQQSALLGAQAAMSLYGGKVTPKGDTYNVTVTAGLITDKQALALEIVKMLRQYKRHNGNVSLGIG